jgi:tetratricopeptide (TPR) repeat protein
VTVEEAISQLENAQSTRAARAIAKAFGREPGFSEAFFQRVHTLIGSNPGAASRLASRWPVVFEQGDNQAYALRAKAAAERLRGQWAQSASSFIAAGEHADSPLHRLSFQSGAVDSLARAGRTTEAVALGKKLSAGLEKMGALGLAARVKLNLGNAFIWKDRYTDAQRWLAQAAPVLEREGFELEAAAANLALSTSELFGANPANAQEHALKAKQIFLEKGLSYFAGICDTNLAHDALLRGRPDEGLRLLIELREVFKDSTPDMARVEEYLGDAYQRLNLYEEALSSYRAAIRLQRGIDSLPNRANCELGRAQVYLSQKKYGQAAGAFGEAASRYHALGNQVWESAARVGEALALIGLKRPGMDRMLEITVSALKRCRSRFHLANALVARAELACGMSEDPAAWLTPARRIARRHGYSSLEWRIHAITGRSSEGQARLRHYRRAFEALLRDRIRSDSRIARANFLRDKSEFISEYLLALLERPSRHRVRRAVAIIAASRSAALIDEILGSRSDGLSNKIKAELEMLREQFNSVESEDVAGNTSRASAPPLRRAELLYKRWTESSALATDLATVHSVARSAVGTIYAEAADGYFKIQGGQVQQLSITRKDLERSLKWLEYEMLAPTVDRDSDPASALALLREMRAAVSGLGLSGGLSPDGALWRVPWQALSNLDGTGSEPILLPSPSFSTAGQNLTLARDAKAAIWVGEWANLPHVAEELERFQGHYPRAKVFRTLQEIRHGMNERWDVLHVATHARVNEENAMFSYLQFSDGKLFAAEIARSLLRADLVVLSACETGSVTFTFKEEPAGLARAFLACSAKAVLASSWVLDDEAAALFTDQLYTGLCGGANLIDSVSAARAACRNWRAHPYYWAPFVVFGGYSA